MGFPTVETVRAVVERTCGMMGGYVTDKVTVLSSPLTSDATSMSTVQPVQEGLLEVGTELVMVTSVSGTTATVIRGWQGTTPEAHSSGDVVYIQPAYPRSVVLRELQSVIRGLYPQLFAVVSVDLVERHSNGQHTLPDGCLVVLSVAFKANESTGWEPVTAYDVDLTESILHLPYVTGGTLRVVYGKRPVVPEYGDAWSVTGLPDSCIELVSVGVQANLLPYVDVQRVGMVSVEADLMDGNRTVGSGVTIARQLQSRYAMLLERERTVMLGSYAKRSHDVR